MADPPSAGRHAVVIGSGAGGGMAAWVLVRAGFQVTVLEKGRNYFRGLDDPRGLGLPILGGDEIGHLRGLPGYDTLGEPTSYRSHSDAAAGLDRSFTGDAKRLPITVGGGTTHWDAKTPRFFAMDFEMRSRFGPVANADVQDWPFGYDDLAPYYEAVETLIGVSGDLERTPDFVLREAPRGPYPLPPGPPMYSSLVFAEAAEALGYQPHPFPMAINSRAHDGRPACNNCGMCAGFVCPINARAGAAVTTLRRALLSGARLVTRAAATRIGTDSTGRATHVEYLAGDRMLPTRIEADVVVLAASPIESARIALLSRGPAHPEGLGNSSGRVGRTVCFHVLTFVGGVMQQRLHPHRGRNSSHCMLEGAIPDTGTRWARVAGLPYLRGGVAEIGTSPGLIEEALAYDDLPFLGRGRHKELMRSSPLRDRLLSALMIGEDLPQLANRVDLDPSVRDVYGVPVARLTHDLHRHDTVASWVWGRRLQRGCKAAGADRSFCYPAGLRLTRAKRANNSFHVSGTLRMGSSPESSVTDEFGLMHDAPNVVVCDASVFPTSGAVNPTLTIMSVAWRNATALGHGDSRARRGPPLDPWPVGAAGPKRVV
jgi:gluconate 2-dehydrogenase alpha chain